MANEENTQDVENENESKVDETEEQQPQTPQEEEKLFTQSELDEKIKGRLAKVHKKYEGYSEYKEQASKVEGLEAKVKELEKERETLLQEKDLTEWKKKAYEKTGIEPSILRGSTEEEIMEHAEAIKSTITYPTIKQGENPNGDGLNARTSRQKLEDGLDRGNFGF